jgi:hypothetical protein
VVNAWCTGGQAWKRTSSSESDIFPGPSLLQAPSSGGSGGGEEVSQAARRITGAS